MQRNAIISIVAIIPLLLGMTTTYPGDKRYGSSVPICFRKHGVLVPMRGSCHGFFICMEGNAIASSCGSFYRFNKETKHCDHPERVNCDEVASIDELEYVTVMPMPPVMPTIVYTPGILHLPKPQHPDEVVADDAAGDICQRKSNGMLLPKVDSCSQYYVCILHRPYRRTCPPMMHFNAERQLCQDPALANCLAKRTPVQDESNRAACKGMPNDLLLPHEYDCTKFYNCQDEKSNEMTCPDGLHFSVRHQNCQWPILANCSV